MIYKKSNDNGVYYFLGNITSHVLHALPLYQALGGTFVVLSNQARREVEEYNVPVININNIPYKLARYGRKIKPISHYTDIGLSLKKTTDFLNKNAKVVIFYELYSFDPKVLPTDPTLVFLTHGNMIKSYMEENNRLEKIKQYDYMASLGPNLKNKFISLGIPKDKLVDIGIARNDEVVKNSGKVVVAKSIVDSLGIDPKKPIVSYMPTFWGASSVYDTGLAIVKNISDECTLLFRPHPQTPKKILRRYFDIINGKDNVFYVGEGKYPDIGLIELFDASSAIIGDVSSVMLEAILTYKPLVYAYGSGDNSQKNSEYSIIADVVRKSNRVSIDNAINITHIINRAVEESVDNTTWNKAIKQNFFHADGTSVESIKKFVESLL